MQQQSEHPALSADDLKVIKKAIKCPKSLIKSDTEKAFLQETADRFGKFAERIFLSEKQIAWLRKIVARMEGAGSKQASGKAKPEPADDLPAYGELAGE